jgi:hypothetical protein
VRGLLASFYHVAFSHLVIIKSMTHTHTLLLATPPSNLETAVERSSPKQAILEAAVECNNIHRHIVVV